MTRYPIWPQSLRAPRNGPTHYSPHLSATPASSPYQHYHLHQWPRPNIPSASSHPKDPHTPPSLHLQLCHSVRLSTPYSVHKIGTSHSISYVSYTHTNKNSMPTTAAHGNGPKRCPKTLQAKHFQQCRINCFSEYSDMFAAACGHCDNGRRSPSIHYAYTRAAHNLPMGMHARIAQRAR